MLGWVVSNLTIGSSRFNRHCWSSTTTIKSRSHTTNKVTLPGIWWTTRKVAAIARGFSFKLFSGPHGNPVTITFKFLINSVCPTITTIIYAPIVVTKLPITGLNVLISVWLSYMFWYNHRSRTWLSMVNIINFCGWKGSITVVIPLVIMTTGVITFVTICGPLTITVISCVVGRIKLISIDINTNYTIIMESPDNAIAT